MNMPKMPAPMRIMKIMAQVRMVDFRASKAPGTLSRPKAAPMTPAMKAPMAPVSVGVTMPV